MILEERTRHNSFAWTPRILTWRSFKIVFGTKDDEVGVFAFDVQTGPLSIEQRIDDATQKVFWICDTTKKNGMQPLFLCDRALHTYCTPSFAAVIVHSKTRVNLTTTHSNNKWLF
jgi:hypothetical protein